jgi:hypothetical protein
MHPTRVGEPVSLIINWTSLTFFSQAKRRGMSARCHLAQAHGNMHGLQRLFSQRQSNSSVDDTLTMQQQQQQQQTGRSRISAAHSGRAFDDGIAWLARLEGAERIQAL